MKSRIRLLKSVPLYVIDYLQACLQIIYNIEWNTEGAFETVIKLYREREQTHEQDMVM